MSHSDTPTSTEADRLLLMLTDTDRQRTDARKALRSMVDMLTDALHANDAGRVAVVTEFLERSIETGTKALAATRDL